VSERDKRLTLVASILASGVVFLDGTVVNVALPAISSDLHGGLVTQQWVVDAYLLTLGSLILAGGSYADIRGRKHALVLGTALFALMSLACAVAPTSGFLIGARALQGIAGALLVPASLAILTATYEDPAERGAAIGTWTAFTGIAFVIGTLVGGTIVQAISWRGVFAINLPLAALTLWIANRYAHESRDPEASGSIDWPAALLSMIFLGGLVFALIEQPQHGWGSPIVWVPLAAAAVALPAFLWREAHVAHPMLPLRLFRVRNFSVVNASTLAIYGGLSAFTFFLVIYLQEVGGYTPLAAGAALVPTTVVMFLLSRRFGALALRVGPHLLMSIGPLIGALGLLLFRRVDTHPNYWTEVLPGIVIFSLGLSMTVAPLTAVAMSSVDAIHAGVASGVNNAVARVAGLLAIAIVGAVVATSFANALDHKLSPQARTQAEAEPLVTRPPASVPPGERAQAGEVLSNAAVHAFRTGTTVGAVLVACGGLIAAIGLRNPRTPTEASVPVSGAPATASTPSR
jgi:EmrB/QacA subfamily drug resistance transporter